MLAKQVLSQLSYTPTVFAIFILEHLSPLQKLNRVLCFRTGQPKTSVLLLCHELVAQSANGQQIARF
jgi:hypothetical protein